MRLIRYAALFGSLMLLVGTSVLLINSRARERSDQIAQVESAADVLDVAVRANLDAAVTSVEIAGAAASSTDSDPTFLATRLAEMFADAQACVGGAETVCTGPDLFALGQVGLLVGDVASGVVAGVDPATDSVLVVGRTPTADDSVTVVVQIPRPGLVRDRTWEIVADHGVEPVLDLSSETTADTRSDAVVTDGVRAVDATIGDIFVNGSITVRTTVDGGISMLGSQPGLYTTLLVLGAILLGLALWTFLLDRRSLQRQATTDELTGLINRREFERIADEALDLSDRFGTGLCVMVVDLNGFKQVNDTMGHHFGDLVLTASAERLTEAVRDTDVVARWGGDEFVIMLPGLQDRTAVRNSAERISETLGGSPVVGDTTITASIGAAIFPRHGETLDALMRTADVAMYGAKTTGVGYRIADTISAQNDLFGDRVRTGDHDESPAGRTIETRSYVGPDRRQNVPLPPPDPARDTATERETSSP